MPQQKFVLVVVFSAQFYCRTKYRDWCCWKNFCTLLGQPVIHLVTETLRIATVVFNKTKLLIRQCFSLKKTGKIEYRFHSYRQSQQ